MRQLRSLFAVVGTIAGLVASPIPLRAQFPSDVQVGSRVRVWLPEEYRQQEGTFHRQLLRGSIQSMTADSLRLSITGTSGTVTIPRSTIRRLDLSRGQPSRIASGVERAAGFAAGGAVLWALMNDPRRSGGPHYRTDWRAAGVGALHGAGFGLTLGILFPHEQWRRLRLSR